MIVISVVERANAPSGLTPEAEFWAWFVAHEGLVWSCVEDMDRVFPIVLGRLERVHPDLSFDIGRLTDGRRELVLTACGQAAGFPAVFRLAATAPPLKRWTVRAFRPRRPVEGEVQGCGETIPLHQVRFTAERVGNRLEIDLFVPGFRRTWDNEFEGLGCFLVDLAIGEFDAEMHVARVKTGPPRPELDSRPLAALPALVDTLPKN